MAQEERTPKQRQHIHRCPVCDRLRRVVRANTKQLREQIWSIDDLPQNGVTILTQEETAQLSYRLLAPLTKIICAVDMHTMKDIEAMADADVEEYIQEYFNPEGSLPAFPKLTSSRSERPKLTLIMGGKQSETEKENRYGR